jgi:hypothetical protein
MKKEKNLECILSIVIMLLVFYLIFKIKILIPIAILIGAVGLFSNYLTDKISWLWLKLSQFLGFVISKIFLTIIFYVFLLPIALVSRLFTKDNMYLKRRKGSYYFSREHEYISDDFENIW